MVDFEPFFMHIFANDRDCPKNVHMKKHIQGNEDLDMAEVSNKKIIRDGKIYIQS